MDSISVRAGVGLALDMLGASVLRESDNLNRFVDFVTGGQVNRNVLAERVWHTVGQMAREFAASPAFLSERHTTLAPLALTALLLGEKSEMIDAVGKLAKEAIHVNLTQADQSGIRTEVVAALGDVSADLASKLAAHIDEKSSEKMLATMVGRHGWEPLDKLLGKSLNAYAGATFLYRQMKNVIDMGIVANPEINRGADDLGFYSVVADMANHAINDRGILEIVQPLRAFLPSPDGAIAAVVSAYQATSAGVTRGIAAAGEIAETVIEHIADASAVVVNTTHYVAETVPLILENLQLATGIGMESVVISDAFAQEASKLQGDATPIPVDAKDSEIAERYLTELLIASNRRPREEEDVPAGAAPPAPETVRASTTEAVDPAATAASNVMQALTEMGEADPARASEAMQIVDALSEQQLAPLDRSGIAVVKTLTGKMTEIDAVSHRLLERNTRYSEDVEKGLTIMPVAVSDLSGYRVDSAFADDFERLALVMSDDAYGMSDTAVEGARTMLNTFWGAWGSETSDLSHAGNTQLKQLWNVCGRNAQVMQEATQYLSLGVAQTALADPLKAHFLIAGSDKARVDVGNGVWVDLESIDAPEYRFDIRNHDGLVNVSIEAHWPISAFGASEAAMRTPQGEQNSALISTVSVTIRAMPDDSLAVNYYAMGTTATIENKIAFDSATGRLADPLAL
ncbi:hypothetical protein [Robbsia sp. KACC 23696]|uniref:hypothetical protein n=1 Tax=Robbsia sp. KACC 23696 TaxID=3149231 RepID=UPI00325C2C47